MTNTNNTRQHPLHHRCVETWRAQEKEAGGHTREETKFDLCSLGLKNATSTKRGRLRQRQRRAVESGELKRE